MATSEDKEPEAKAYGFKVVLRSGPDGGDVKYFLCHCGYKVFPNTDIPDADLTFMRLHLTSHILRGDNG